VLLACVLNSATTLAVARVSTDAVVHQAPMGLIEIPKYITSEADLDAYFKQQGTKVVRHNTIVATTNTEEELLAEDQKEQSSTVAAPADDTAKEKAPETMLINIPKYVTSEADLDAYFKKQGTKVNNIKMGIATTKTEEDVVAEWQSEPDDDAATSKRDAAVVAEWQAEDAPTDATSKPTVADPAPATMLFNVPKYTTSETDLDASFTHQGTKVLEQAKGVATTTTEEVLEEGFEENRTQ